MSVSSKNLKLHTILQCAKVNLLFETGKKNEQKYSKSNKFIKK